MKTKQLFLLLIFCISGVINAQLAGKKFKTPFTAVDGHTYRVGETLKIGFPTKGESFQTVLYYKFENALESVSKILDVASGTSVETSKIYYASKNIKEYEGKVLYFKENSNGTYAIIEYQNGYHIAIPLNNALPIREVISNNPEYKDKLLSNTTADFSDDSTKLKSFSSNFNVKLISAEGDINQQTVTLTFLISHKLIHQEVCFNGDEKSKLYDFNGNEHNGKEISVGTATRGVLSNYACNKIPTNIPVKAKVVFNQILPSTKEFSYAEIKVGYKAFDSYDSYQYGNIEVNNIKVDWK